jgi:hypothetical protein
MSVSILVVDDEPDVAEMASILANLTTSGAAAARAA